MGSRQGEDALTFMAEFLGDLLDALAFAQYLPRRLDDPLPRRSDPGQMLAAAGEHLYPQLILEQTDLFADPGLGGVQALGCRRYVEVVVCHFPYIAKLLQ